jgi:cell division protein FtsB
MKKTLVIIILGLSGVIGYLMDQNVKLKQENDELFMENVSLEESVESLNQIWLDEYEPTY